MLNNDHPATVWISNLIGTGAIVSSILGFIPAIAAVVALLWYFIQISESRTVQAWIRDRRLRKIAHYKARAIILEAKLHNPVTPLTEDFGGPTPTVHKAKGHGEPR